MAPLEVKDPSLHDLIAPDAPIERVAGGFAFTEGPVWRGGCLLFSDIPNKRIARWRRLPEGPELTTYATGMSNGLTLDGRGPGARGGARWPPVTRVVGGRHTHRPRGAIPGQAAQQSQRHRAQVRRLDLLHRSALRVEPSIRGGSRPPAGGPSPYRERSRPRTACTVSPPTEPCTSWPTTSPCRTVLAFSPGRIALYIDDSAQKHIRAFSVRRTARWPMAASSSTWRRKTGRA
jgi:hypothetical protein